MDTDNDIEVLDLQVIEARLRTDSAETDAHSEDAATRGFTVGSASAFLVT